MPYTVIPTETYVALGVISEDGVNEGHKEVLRVLRPSACEVGTERVQYEQVLIRSVEQRLREHHDEEPQELDADAVVSLHVVVRRVRDRDA